LPSKPANERSSSYNDDTNVIAADPRRYTLEFHAAGTIGIGADCNRVVGTFVADLGRVTSYVMDDDNLVLNLQNVAFGPLALTRVACPSDEATTQEQATQMMLVRPLARAAPVSVEMQRKRLHLRLRVGYLAEGGRSP
jgi:heat shock protein HslJ